ncbi:MAG: phosphatidylserine decarboxylase [Methyloversatilis sp.]|nr:phosphatidylserine decarboxylase [Methyloversatilis sp.]
MNDADLPARRRLRDALNFALTNRVPRAALTRFAGWFSRIEQPLVRDMSIALWRLFGDVDLSEAKKPRFASLHDCFVRELRAGARPVDADPLTLVSPCDGIVVACGRIEGDMLLQAKGLHYTLEELLGDAALAARFHDGCYATVRITASMYHRFHAPHDCRVSHVTYFPGDTWNVNPPALARVDKLYCRNERAAITTALADGTPVLLVPVAAILVASLRLHCLDLLLHAGYRGPHRLTCDATLCKGDEMGWFQHGSTIIVLAPSSMALHPLTVIGRRIRAGEALMRLPGG